MMEHQSSQISFDRNEVGVGWRTFGSGQVALLAILAGVAHSAYGLYLYLRVLELLRQVESGRAPLEAAHEYLFAHGAYSAWMWAAAADTVLLVSFMLWWSARVRLWRTVRSDAPTVRWSIACWFVPIVGWLTPFRHMRRFASDFGARAPTRLWQIGTICGHIAFVFSTALYSEVCDVETYRRYCYSVVVSNTVQILSLLAMSGVLVGLSRRVRV